MLCNVHSVASATSHSLPLCQLTHYHPPPHPHPTPPTPCACAGRCASCNVLCAACRCGCSCGTQPDRSASGVSSPRTFATRRSRSLSMTSRVRPHTHTAPRHSPRLRTIPHDRSSSHPSCTAARGCLLDREGFHCKCRQPQASTLIQRSPALPPPPRRRRHRLPCRATGHLPLIENSMRFGIALRGVGGHRRVHFFRHGTALSAKFTFV
jgi:hypothetical protein